MARIAGSVVLFFIEPMSIDFFVVYLLCGATDALDGFVARKTHSESRMGAALDSAADLTFIGALAIVLIPHVSWPGWLLIWIGAIALVRAASLAIALIKYRALAPLHTRANKATGVVLFCLPLLLWAFGLPAAGAIACGIATASALEELAIHIRSRVLWRDVPDIFHIRA